MKWASLLIGNMLVAAAVIFAPAASAQAAVSDACKDALQAQTKDQIEIDADVECADNQQPLGATDQAEPDVKGRPSPETVAGHEQQAQNQGVLGASTAVLAETNTNVLTATGSSPLMAIGVGLLLLGSVVAISAATKKS